MKNKFEINRSYPDPTKAFGFVLQSVEEIKNSCLFVLDTNVLLLPFTTDVKSLNAIGDVYRDLATDKRLFLPAHAVREYLDNRAAKIANINESLSRKSNQSFQFVGDHPLLSDLKEYKEVLAQENVLKKAITDYRNKLRATLSTVQAWRWDDPVSKMYHEVLLDCILDDSSLDYEKFEADLKRRNELNIPPGYKDKTKQTNSSGDLLIWHEILNLGESQENHVVFVSGDDKADWWHQSGKSPLYPRFELVDEFRERTDGKSFHIISLSKLLTLFEAGADIVDSVKDSEVISVQSASTVNIVAFPLPVVIYTSGILPRLLIDLSENIENYGHANVQDLDDVRGEFGQVMVYFRKPTNSVVALREVRNLIEHYAYIAKEKTKTK